MSRKQYAHIKEQRNLLRKKLLTITIERNQGFMALRLARDQIRSYEERLTGVGGVAPIVMKIDEILSTYGQDRENQ